MAIEDREFGRFESLVLEKLNALKDMGQEIKDCQKAMKADHAMLAARVARLEHQETRLIAYMTIMTFIVGVLVKIFVK